MREERIANQLLQRRLSFWILQRRKHQASRERYGDEGKPRQPKVRGLILCTLTGYPIERGQKEVELQLDWNCPKAAVVGSETEILQESGGVNCPCKLAN